MEREELLQRYYEVRLLLEDLVAAWPLFLPGSAYEHARCYLDFHCAECGARLTMNDLAGVLELELVRLGTVDVREVTRADAQCLDCYRTHQRGEGVVLSLEPHPIDPGAPSRLLSSDVVEDASAPRSSPPPGRNT
jgi:hypothetical protein